MFDLSAEFDTVDHAICSSGWMLALVIKVMH